MHADAAAVGDEDIAVMERIFHLGPTAIRFGRSPDVRKGLDAERLMRPLAIGSVDEGVEARLSGRGLRGGIPDGRDGAGRRR